MARKLSSFWRRSQGSPLQPDLDRFLAAAAELGFTERVASAGGVPVVGPAADPDRPAARRAHRSMTSTRWPRPAGTGSGGPAGAGGTTAARCTLPGRCCSTSACSTSPPPPEPSRCRSRSGWPTGAREPLRPRFVAYLERKLRHLPTQDGVQPGDPARRVRPVPRRPRPDLASLAALDRRRHIEPYLTSLATARQQQAPVSRSRVADQDRRVNAAANFLAEITEWGWADAPTRRLLFPLRQCPALPRPLPRYLPVDADRRLTQALAAEPFYRLAADALLLQRACGLRIGELLDLELDCVHEVPGHGAWLKVPLGKLDTERMVPLDDETLDLLDRIIATRSGGRPVRTPAPGAPPSSCSPTTASGCLRTRSGRAGPRRPTAGIGHITPHQLRHTYATALVNAGVSLQALMALLGHVSAEMSLRYAPAVRHHRPRRIRTRPRPGQSQIGPLPTGRPEPAAGRHHRRRRLARHPADQVPAGRRVLPPRTRPRRLPLRQHLRTLPQLPHRRQLPAVLAAQRVDAAALAADAEARGWIDEADRHQRLLARLDTLITQARPDDHHPSTASNAPAASSPTPASRSPSPPSPPAPDSAAPPSTATRTSAPSSRNTAPAHDDAAPSPASPPRSPTSAPPSKPSPTT